MGRRVRSGASELDFQMAVWMLERRSDLGPVIELLRALYGIIDDWTARYFMRKLEEQQKVRVWRVGRRNLYRPAGPLVADEVVLEKKRRQGAGWDGRWCLVTYDLPQQATTMRRRLIRSMRQVGLGELTQSTWISPYDWSAQVSADAETYQAAEHLNWALGAHVILHGSPAEAVRDMWPLAELADRYRQLRERARSTPKSDLGQPALGNALRIAKDWMAVELDDPMLPAQLLPTDWPAAEARSAIEELRRRVADALVPAS
ncbi:MAG: PaaX family transcriptional regulator C-terminal domain-containing protein [Planctomycetota bacterium]